MDVRLLNHEDLIEKLYRSFNTGTPDRQVLADEILRRLKERDSWKRKYADMRAWLAYLQEQLARRIDVASKAIKGEEDNHEADQ